MSRPRTVANGAEEGGGANAEHDAVNVNRTDRAYPSHFGEHAVELLVIGFEQLPGGQTAVRKPGGQVEAYAAHFRVWCAQR